MKKILFVLSVCWLVSACSTDLDITAKWKDITVVYGLLNPVDQQHYLRINKAFLCDCNALEVARIADSINYAEGEISVEIQKILNGNVVSTRSLERVDGNSIGLPKDTNGIFASDENILYRYNEVLDPQAEYRLVIHKSNGETVQATTPVVNDFNIFRPNPLYDEVNWASGSPFELMWFAARNGVRYDVIIRTWYWEWEAGKPDDKVLKYVDWLAISGVEHRSTNANDMVRVKINGEEFYYRLKSAIQENPGVRRQLTDAPLTFIFYVGAEDLSTFIKVNQAQTGITSLQALTKYTNIENGLGIFSSRYYKEVDSIRMHGQAIDSLACGSITQALNFANSSLSFNCN